MRLTPEEYDALREAADDADLPMGVWARERLLAAAKRARRG
jgi:hypothetical protein